MRTEKTVKVGLDKTHSRSRVRGGMLGRPINRGRSDVVKGTLEGVQRERGVRSGTRPRNLAVLSCPSGQGDEASVRDQN